MTFKKSKSLVLSIALVLSIIPAVFAGNDITEAAVQSNLPTVAGLYVADYVDQNWETGKALTDTDAAGNTVPVNVNNEAIHYMDQENPEYLTKGVAEGWGPGFDPGDSKWFDYIADGKVTHVNPSDLVVTKIDGTPIDTVSITADERDSRIAVINAKEEGKFKITYKGATVNNSFIAQVSLRTGFYTSETMSVSSLVRDETNVLAGKTKDFYLHLTDDWEEAGFEFDYENNVLVRYWNNEKDGDEEITGLANMDDFVSITPVSVNNPNHLIYKVTFKGNTAAGNRYDFRFKFNRYEINNPSSSWEDERGININIVEPNLLYGADYNNLLIKNGQYYYSLTANYDVSYYYAAGSTKNPIYIKLKYTDENGNMNEITDPSRITIFTSYYDEPSGKDMFEKAANDVIKIEKAYPDSDIFKITMLKALFEFSNSYVLTYNGAEPKQFNENKNITVNFSPARFNEIGTYKATTINDDNYATEFKTDGTADIDIYAATVDVSDEVFWNTIKSVELKELSLTDENGKNLTDKLLRSKNVTMTDVKGRPIIYAEKFTIPKGTLDSSAKLFLRVSIDAVGGDGRENKYDMSISDFIFYSKPVPVNDNTNKSTPAPSSDSDKAKTPEVGTTAQVNGATYKITSTGSSNTVSFVQGKKNIKSVKIPDTVKIDAVSYKVTEIAGNAFKGNKKLTTITVGKNVTKLGKNAFAGIKGLKKIIFKTTKLTAKTVKKGAFKGVGKKVVIKAPKSKKSAYKKFFYKKGLTKKVKIK